jgi:hypothetical protein
MNAPYTPESKPVCSRTRPSGEPPDQPPPNISDVSRLRFPGQASAVSHDRIKIRTREPQMLAHKTARHPTLQPDAATHDSRTCNTSAACAGVNNNTSVTTNSSQCPPTGHPLTPNTGPPGTHRAKISQTRRPKCPSVDDAPEKHASVEQSPAVASAGHDDRVSPSAFRDPGSVHRGRSARHPNSSTKRRNASCPSRSTNCKISTGAACCYRSSESATPHRRDAGSRACRPSRNAARALRSSVGAVDGSPTQRCNRSRPGLKVRAAADW